MRSSGTQALIVKSWARPSSVWARKAVPSPSRWPERYSTRRQARFQQVAASRSAMAAQTLPTGAAIVRDSYVVGMVLNCHAEPACWQAGRAGLKDGGGEG